jgi:hypothetical protein
MERVENIEASKASSLKEVWELTKSPKYDLSTTLIQALEGLYPQNFLT